MARMNFDTVYGTLDEKFVNAVKLYPGEDDLLYLDEDCKVVCPKDVLINLFVKGNCLVVTGKSLFRPLELAIEDEYAGVCIGYKIKNSDLEQEFLYSEGYAPEEDVEDEDVTG